MKIIHLDVHLSFIYTSMINIQKLFSYDIVLSNSGFSYFDEINEFIKTRQNIKYNIRRIRLDLLLNRKEIE